MRPVLRGILVAVVAALAVPSAPAGAQQPPMAGTVSPGMTRAQVISALGEPITYREASGYTYVFYQNDCARTCGINDLVVLKGDSVVDAIFRSPSRKYTGKSSSPAPIPSDEARKIGAGGAGALIQDPAPAKPRMKPAPANDVRPSIPTKSPLVAAPPAAKPTAKAESKAPAKADVKTPPKAEAKTPPKADAKVPPKVEPKVAPKADAKAPPKAETKTPARADAKTPPPKVDAKAPPAANPQAKVPPKTDAKPASSKPAPKTP
ncbi:MAG: hypothetical protein V4550_07785 [Gemmatimonadota bacterium]